MNEQNPVLSRRQIHGNVSVIFYPNNSELETKFLDGIEVHDKARKTNKGDSFLNIRPMNFRTTGDPSEISIDKHLFHKASLYAKMAKLKRMYTDKTYKSRYGVDPPHRYEEDTVSKGDEYIENSGSSDDDNDETPKPYSVRHNSDSQLITEQSNIRIGKISIAAFISSIIKNRPSSTSKKKRKIAVTSLNRRGVGTYSRSVPTSLNSSQNDQPQSQIYENFSLNDVDSYNSDAYDFYNTEANSLYDQYQRQEMMDIKTKVKYCKYLSATNFIPSHYLQSYIKDVPISEI